ncbi:glycosyl hydrolase family 18 protein [uncultured Succiniclasticum sp.]|uniref:glycosyl hydrolase family 18 protein n=1 Tax=uncultured Succiniclasticum sp. TaxID=1500547 RepID=UPI0025F6B634|nr:glycosyl hydrolase family 18 protein [uncultured Succiniclasticum sp.]
MGKFVKSGIFAAIGSAVLLIAGCLPLGLSVDAARRGQPTFDGNAWVTYWDFEQGMKEAMAIQTQLNSISYFAAVLDGEGKPMVMGHSHQFTGKKFTRYRAKVNKYLTVVNDVYKDIHNPKGETIAKDTQVLLKLFETPETMQEHAANMIALVKRHRFDGLELDYENIWKDPEVARRYVRFLEILASLADKEEIPLRVILEPGFFEFGDPITTLATMMEDFTVPEGPEYVVMCYNLYGIHSKTAGAKADIPFLKKVLFKLSYLPRPRSVALATGGCVWQDGRAPYFVTENEALLLQRSLKAKATRDAGSQAMSFKGKNAAGKNVECWFADAKTIVAWKRQALDYGVDGISLWRLGGNHKIQEYYPGIMNKK